ncbi:MAG: hypothetical protein C3F12_14605 [Candidatus Methylomirabilota bacterium]|nr:UPF0158 family protein [Candidatus Methylomirabilis sp.]NJD68659.1 hypothetical protein [candidate division NC10 bacterium]PWB42425.1 MAG: hypothetical protein C3F12_14605 [candidate division NC10 bacterium]
MVTITYEDLSLAFDFVSSGAPMEHRAYVSLDTGRIYWMSELNPIQEEETPDDLGTSDRFLAIPHKNDLNLGRRLALRFVEAHLPHRYDRVADIFRHRGAYGCFKEVLAAEGCLEQWYAFEAEATEDALKEWCRRNGVHLVGPDEKPTGREGR